MTQSMQQEDYAEFLAFGDSLVSETRHLIVSLWNKSSIHSTLKEDQTPVSEIDMRCEELVRQRIRQRFPAHGMIGEEFGTESKHADFVWTIDPIDGTQNLINRIPTFGTILALLYRGTPVLGWIDHPVLGDSLRGGVTNGVYCNNTRITLDDISPAGLTPNDVIGTNCPATFARGGHGSVLNTILDFHPHTRMYYDVYAHSLTIRGSLAAMVEYNLKIWDLAATQALIQGAGGEYRELGRVESGNGPNIYHAAFGKQRAVDLLSAAILDPMASR